MRKGGSDERAQQEEIERYDADKAYCEDEVGVIGRGHVCREKNQIRFANLRQVAEGSVALSAI
jgi:hypothetical protein